MGLVCDFKAVDNGEGVWGMIFQEYVFYFFFFRTRKVKRRGYIYVDRVILFFLVFWCYLILVVFIYF